MNNIKRQNYCPGEILIVDDDISSLKYMSDLLTKENYQVRAANDGELALRSIKSKLPDLILLDINMPGIDGVEVCKSLKSDPVTADIPIIFISAEYKTQLKIKAFESGCIDYVTKPVKPAEVLTRINTHLNMHRMQQKLIAQSEQLRTDIAERKKTEIRLIQSQERYREIQSLAHIGHWNYEVLTERLTWSSETYAIFGVDKETGPLTVKGILARIHPKDRDTIRKQIEKGESYRSDYRIIMDDGSEKYIHEDVMIVRREDGKITNMKGTAQDITKESI